MPEKQEKVTKTTYYDVGTFVSRTGSIYQVVGPPRRDGKYPVRRVQDNRSLVPELQHFSGKDLYLYKK